MVLRALLCATIVALLAPAAASAATFCVHRPVGCVGTDQPNLQAALDAARANGSGRDEIRIGVGLFSDGPAVNRAGSPVDIVGAAANQTAIRTNSTTGGVTILDIQEPTSTVSDLRVHHSSAAPTATGLGLAGEAHDVMVTNQGVTGQFDGIRMAGPDASLDDSSVSLVYPDNVQNRAIAVASGADAVITDSYVEGSVGVTAAGDATIVRLRAHATQGVVAGGGTTVAVRDSEIRTPGPMASNFQVAALAAAGSGATNLDVDRVTAYATDRRGFGVWVVPNGGAGNNAVVELDGSVLAAYPTAVRLSESAGANASLDVARSAYTLSATSLDAGASYTTGTGMIDLRSLDPGFRAPDTGGLALRHDSPLVDAGDPAYQPLLGFDVRLLIRVRDGNGNGSAVVDLGAHEYQRLAPVAAAVADPLTVQAGAPVAFDAGGSSDADEDELTFSWAFDDGGSASGEEVQHAFATAGEHRATVTVTDATGLSARAVVTVTVEAPPAAPGGGGQGGGSSGGGTPGPSGGAAANVAPSLSGLRVAPARFRVLARPRARVAARRPAAPTAPVGADVRYTLSEPARVTLAVERPAPGRRAGRACRRPTRANRAARPCTRWVLVGRLGVDGDRGANSTSFTGRLRGRALAPGRYRLRARARDVGGLLSAPVAPRGFVVVR